MIKKNNFLFLSFLRRDNHNNNNNNLIHHDVVNSTVAQPDKMSPAVLAYGVPDALLGTLCQQQQQLPQAPHHHSDDALSPGPDPEGDRRHKVVHKLRETLMVMI